MAIVSRDTFFQNLASGTKWSAGVSFTRTNALPIDDKSVFQSLEEAQTYAQSATAYPGQVVAVVETGATSFYGINQAGELQDLGGSSAPMLFVDSQEEMLALEDIEQGQQVYRDDTHTVWIFKGGLASNIDNWVESASQNDTVWNGTQNRVLFYAVTQSQYDGIGSKDTNTLYFVTDSGRVYKGDVDVSTSIVPVASFPDVSAAILRKAYVNTDTLEMRMTTDNAAWLVLSPGYVSLTDGINWAEADSNKFATIGFIKQGIQEALATVSTNAAWEKATGTLTVGSGTGAVLSGVAHDVQYDSSQMILTIPVYGGSNVVVNIPKDSFVTSGQYYEDYPAEGEPTHHNVIVLTLENQEDPVIIPASGLVDVYTANNEGKDITIEITADNQISATAKIDPAGGNALVTSANGLMVDISGKMDKISSATGTRLVLSTADGNVSESSYSVVASGDMGSSNTTIPTANLIAAAIAATVNTSVANKVDKVVGVVDNFVGFAEEGAIKDTGKKSGGATLAEVPDANTLATEAAVKDAVDNVAIYWGSIEE